MLRSMCIEPWGFRADVKPLVACGAAAQRMPNPPKNRAGTNLQICPELDARFFGRVEAFVGA